MARIRGTEGAAGTVLVDRQSRIHINGGEELNNLNDTHNPVTHNFEILPWDHDTFTGIGTTFRYQSSTSIYVRVATD